MAQVAIDDRRLVTPRRAGGAARAVGRNKWAIRAVVWGALVLAWYLLARAKGPFFLATPGATVEGLVKLQTEGYYSALGASLRQLGVGFALAVAVGVPVGLLMGSVRLIDDLLAPFVNTLFVTPKEALLPFLITLFGTRLNFRIAVVFLFAVFFVVMNASAGVRSVDRDLIEAGRSFGLPMRRIFTRIVLPGSLPFVIAGIRLGLAASIKGMVIAELWVTAGAGLLLKNFAAFRRLDMFLALSIVIIAVGVVSTTLLAALERRLRPWKAATR